jgi:SAM-dependent methyltransferase
MQNNPNAPGAQAPYADALRTNKALWEAWTPVHAHSAFYNLTGFRRRPDSLNATEIEEMGAVEGLSLLHLQCHFGQDTLSWAYRGARRVVGVDFSAASITLARQLAAELGLPARFVQGEVTQAPKLVAGEQFDRVFTSYGTLIWLPALAPWAAAVYRCLRPGGRFYLIDFHPLLETLEPAGSEGAPHCLAFPYFNPGGAGVRCWEQGSYADRSAPVAQPAHFWPHSLGEVVTALTQAGLRLHWLHEHPFCHYDCFPGLVADGAGRWVMQATPAAMPLMYSVLAERPA